MTGGHEQPRGTPPTIGIVGGIGAGKSEIASILAELGCVVSDSDGLAREAFRDEAVVDTLRDRWGGRVIAPDRTVDRAAVAKIVFADPVERAWLESVVHPWIERRRTIDFDVAPRSTLAFVIDAPLLLEAGLDDLCDAVIFVDSPRTQRLERVRRSRGWTEEELDRREATQWPLDRKRRKADIVIVNDGDRSGLRSDVEQALASIVATAGRGPVNR